MGYFDLGISLGLAIYGIIVGLLTFKDSFKEWFYGEVFEDTILGEAGEYLFFPNQNMIENSDAGKTFINVMAFLGIHLFLFALFMLVFTLIGGLLSPLIFLGVVVGPFIYYFVKRKRAKALAKLNEDEETSK